MNKIKIIHHSKTIGYSGTDKVAALFCKYLDKSKFEPFLFYRENDSANTRLNIVEQWIGKDHVIPYKWIPGKKGKQSPYIPEYDNFKETVDLINPDIVHCHLSGYQEFPALKYLCSNSKLIYHNIFGFNDTTRQADLVIYICNYIRNSALNARSVDGPVLYNPVENNPFFDHKKQCREDILRRYGLSDNAVLSYRIGRMDNFDSISLRALSIVEKQNPNVFYFVINPCQGWRDTVRQLNLQNVIFLPTIINDEELHKFYAGMDIHSHARSDGEANSVAISEGMIAGLPTISHVSKIYNGQSESIENCGFVVPLDDYEAYAQVWNELAKNEDMRRDFGSRARQRALDHFEASLVTKKLEEIYESLLSC